MRRSTLNMFVLLVGVFVAAPAFATVPRVKHHVYSTEAIGFNGSGGIHRPIPTQKSYMLFKSGTIKDVSLVEEQGRQLTITIEGGNTPRSNIVFEFKSHDSAAILYDYLTEGTEPLLLLFDYYNSNVVLGGGRFASAKASALYVWNDQNQSVMQIGELIGPRRSVEEQSYLEQMIIRLFGRERLNDVDFVVSPGAQTPHWNL